MALVTAYRGGVYMHPDSGERIPGSPLIMLRAMCAAETAARASRLKGFCLDVEYFFIEKTPSTVDYLRNELHEDKCARNNANRIQVLPGCFSEHLDSILSRIEQRGRSRRVIFVLDQYGFSDVRIDDLRTIFRRLPKAEVILTIAIDWLIDHWTDTTRYDQILADLGIELPASTITKVKHEEPREWREVIQHLLHRELFCKSGATYYTPFFVYSPESHRAYWLLHLSGHSKARDVMMQLHWELENHFQHFGQPGFCMLGYDPRKDLGRLGYRKLPFGFDSFAGEETRLALLDGLPQRIASNQNGIRFETFFNGVVNETPATKQMIAKGISALTLEKELEVRTSEGKLRRNGVQIQDDDIILRPQQRLWFPHG
jgi:three-Cys-motif partner protein